MKIIEKIKKIKQSWKQKKENFDRECIEAVLDWKNDRINKDNKFHCKKCKRNLSLIKMVIIAKSVKDGEIYKIKCRYCKHINKIKKGEN